MFVWVKEFLPWHKEEVKKEKTIDIKTACGTLFVIIAQEEAIFLKLGKPGGCAASQLETIAKLATALLRRGYTLQKLQEKLEGIKCHVHSDETPSCSHALSLAIGKYLEVKS